MKNLSTKLRIVASIMKTADLNDYARNELEMAGLFDKDSDYNGMLGKAVMELCNCFSQQDHSGESAKIVLNLFNSLAQFKPINQITSDKSEWIQITNGLWQSKRDPSLFSKDFGKTWYSIDGKNLKGFVSNIEKDTLENRNFRKVLYTGKNSQLVLMSLKPGEEIGEEVHNDTDQFFRIESGSGVVIINGKKTEIKDGSAIVVPQGATHNIINTGNKPLNLYTIYSPPHHKDGIVHKTKNEAESDKEHFDGKTTEKY